MEDRSSSSSFISNPGEKDNCKKNQGKKRANEIPIIEKFMWDNFRKEIGESRKHFLKTESDASLAKKTGNEHIIYFKAFINYDLVIRNIPTSIKNFAHCFEIHIKPTNWARAFNQIDIVSTTEQLITAVVNAECIRITDLDKTARINTATIIQRAVVWMMSKFTTGSQIDPWSFPLNFSQILELPVPSAADMNTIMFTMRNNEPRRNVDIQSNALKGDQYLNQIVDNLLSNYWDLDDTNDNVHAVDFEKNECEGQKEETKYEEMFKKCVDTVRESGGCGDRLMNMAQIAAALTRSTIPHNTDQFVDAVQISFDRWKKAFKEGNISIGKVAAKLSSTMIRLDFGENLYGFQSAQDLCPVQLAAIYRATKFLHLRKNMKDGYKEIFDSTKPSHNIFPTVEEIREINKELRLHGVGTVLGRLKLTNEIQTESSMSKEKTTVSELEQLSTGNKGMDDMERFDRSERFQSQEALQILGVTTSSQPNLNINVGTPVHQNHQEMACLLAETSNYWNASNNINGNANLANANYLEDMNYFTDSTYGAAASSTAHDINQHLSCIISSSSTSDQVPSTSDLVLNPPPQQIMPTTSWVESSEVQQCLSLMEISVLDRLHLHHCKIRGEITGIEPKLLKEDCTDMVYIKLTIQIKTKDANGMDVFSPRSHAFSKNTWKDAEEKYKTDGPVIVGKKVLLPALFEDHEILEGTPSGKPLKNLEVGQKTKKLDKARQDQLMDALRYLIGKVTVSKPDLYQGAWSIALENHLRIEVFRHGTRQHRLALLKRINNNKELSQESPKEPTGVLM